MTRRKLKQGPPAELSQSPASPEFANVSTHRLIEDFQQEDNYSRAHLKFRADAAREIRRRANAGDQEADDFVVQSLAGSLKRLADLDLPKVPGNLVLLPNSEVERLTDEVERRITLLMEFYSNLDGVESQWAREALDSAQQSLRAERVRRGLPSLAARMEATAAGKTPIESTSRIAVELTERESKIWEVIRRGARGLQYCRELDAAGIKPRRGKSWKGWCPTTYAAAYQVDEPWRHRIQDEKSKVRRKAELAKTRQPLAGE